MKSKVLRHIRLWLAPCVLVLYSIYHVLAPNAEMVGTMQGVYTGFLIGLLSLFCLLNILGYIIKPLGERMLRWSPFWAVIVVLLSLYEYETLKTGNLPLPFFPSPAKIVEAYATEYSELASSFLASMKLLALGFSIGTIVGVIGGILMGCFKKIYYWINPVFRFIGPIPPAAMVPAALILAPTSYHAAVFMVAFAVWYPVTVMTWSAVCEIDKKYYEVAKTIGGGKFYQLVHIVFPAILPSVFFGMYMGFCYAFATLLVAEMLGVGEGLGYYMKMAQAWSTYYKMYAALIIIAIMCSGLIWLLFKVRKVLLRWNKGEMM